MSAPIAYGIDYGTTNSSIAVAYPDRVKLVPISDHAIPALLPSMIYLHREGGRSAGQGAIQEYLVTGAHRTACSECSLVQRIQKEVFTACKQYSSRPGGFCQDARIAAELKSEMASLEFDSTHSWAVDFDLAELTAIVFRTLKQAADRAIGSNVRRAVIGFPVVFAGAEGPDYDKRQAVALKRLTDAAAKAGLDDVEFLQEPVAVVVDERLETGLVVVVDFGGGTFDVAVVELQRDQGEVLALQGAAVGGEKFTAALFDAKVAPILGLDRANSGIPAWVRQNMRTLGGAMRLLSSSQVPVLLRAAQSGPSAEGASVVERVLFGGHGYSFHQAVENAKITLSSKEATSIEFHRPGIKLSIPVTRPEFEELLVEDLLTVKNQLLAALSQAQVSPGDVTAVLRTGGSSGIPAFLRVLRDIFGPSEIHERPAFTAIVRGLAAYAQTRWS